MRLIQWHITLLQSGVNVISACYFTYSPKTQRELNFRKSLMVSYRVYALKLNFLEILCYYILSSHKSLSPNKYPKFLLLVISSNELFITLSTLWVNPLNGALPVPYVQVRVIRDALVAHRYTYAAPRCRTSQCSRTFIPLSVYLWNDISNPIFDGLGLADFKSRANAFLLA